ncbi:DNA alkylation repair protein [Lactobacillus selangorensis]|uniref:DNA alkylation repair protein n=1 Tax=Lactobacillus selangorensis TaxID=81857 RepID=UPI00070F5A9E|nr:DNA alkylation repair protein [Lactobacillus selangorensis]
MATPLKEVYSDAFLRQLGQAVQGQLPAFQVDKFAAAVQADDWSQLRLMERMTRIDTCLHQQFPSDFKAAAPILTAVSHQITGFAALCLPGYVAQYGLDDWQTSIGILAVLTQSSSAEFAIRPFIEQAPAKTMAQILTWSHSDNADLRRLASEGCRPRLPWGRALKVFKHDPAPIFPILENLMADSSKYVRTSVANNLNDISKDHPEQVLQFVTPYWHQSPETDWIIKKALRTLFKAGRPEVMTLFGYPLTAAEALTLARITSQPAAVKIGGHSQVMYQCQNGGERDLPLRLELGVDYIKANGQPKRKIFFLKDTVLAPGQKIDGTHKLNWQQLTTRTLYPGGHQLVLLANTIAIAQTTITVTK